VEGQTLRRFLPDAGQAFEFRDEAGQRLGKVRHT